MSPAAQYLADGGFTRVGPVKGMRGFEVWHLTTAGAADIAVAIPDHDKAERSWAVRGIYSAGEQQGQATIREYWLKLTTVLNTKGGHIGVAEMPEETDDSIPL
jgi:hypothetical protein